MRFNIVVISLLFTLILPLSALTEEGKSSTAVFLNAIQLRASASPEAVVPLFREAAADKTFILNDYAQHEIGKTYFEKGHYAAAIPEYFKLITDQPRSLLAANAYLSIGKSYFNLNNYPLAIKTFRHLVEKFPESKEAPEARFLIAKALEKQNSWQKAYLAYEEVDIYHPLSYFGKKSQAAVKKLKRSHRRGLPHFNVSAEALFKKGMAYFEGDDFEMAANIFNRLARTYPKSKYINQAWLMLGRAEMQQAGQLSSAISNLEKAAQEPSGQAYYYLGLAHGRRGDYGSAIASLKKVVENFPDSDLSDQAAYWSAYYLEASGKIAEALRGYYDLINKNPYSGAVPAAIWRIGRTYYWNSEFKNAATYLHLAQLYPPGEDSPRCYFFEAKALERQGNRAAALDVYKKLSQLFDHTYYGYRAQEKLNEFGIRSTQVPFSGEEFSSVLNGLGGKTQEELAAVMEIWEQTNSSAIADKTSEEVRSHLGKYKELMSLGLTNNAADEARFLVHLTSDVEKESAQVKLGEMLVRSGEYRTPIRFADKKLKSAIYSGKAQTIPRKIWQLAYPKGYWKHIASKADIFDIDPYLVLAVIREESRFNPKAVSRSGARGLMQIMPKTGKGIAKKLELRRYRTSKLFTPTVNVEMGAYYLSDLLNRFGGNIYLSLAGYNGGPNRVKNYVNAWYNGDLKTVDIDEFVESIPSRETRLYVQKVMGSYFEYKRLYGRKG